jgi:hypothetical protein
MPISKEKADLKESFRDNPKAIALYLTESLAKNELGPVLKAPCLSATAMLRHVCEVHRQCGAVFLKPQ